jgi:predicted ATPase
MGAALARHDVLIERLVAEHDGQVVRPRGEGDSRFAVFARASDALAAACAAQVALVQERWPLTEPMRVRMALHTGEANLRLGDYYGPAVNHCARLRAVAHGGQVVVSAVTADLVREALPTEVRLRDLGVHQLKDLDQPEKVWQLVHPKLCADFPPLTSPSARRHNLPNQLSSFVGRDQAIVELRGLLDSTRLLTLTGPGGVGKTRLALRVAAEALQNYADGVWLVRLDALADPNLVPAAVASVLDVGEQPGRLLLESIGDAVGSRHLLLVLDNCEHLLESCADLAKWLLQGCPQLQVLATSREALNVPGECAWRVPSLSLPGAQHATAANELNEYEAVRLFIERASSARSGFALTSQNSTAVVQVCRRLDGIPLAIELTAARVNALSVEQLAQRLDDCFRLLTGGSRTTLPRQQTLRAAIDWSYDLLSGSERVLLRRLAVFTGGWTLEAAEAVCTTGDGIASEEVLELLCSLVDRSVVDAEERDGAQRYRLLETIRQYALERLEASGEAQAVRSQHAEHYAEMAEGLLPAELWSQRELTVLDREQGNLTAALDWCTGAGDLEVGCRLVGALWRFWWSRGQGREVRAKVVGLLERIAANGRAGVRTPNRASAFFAAGMLAQSQNDAAAARPLLESALALLRDGGDQRLLINCLHGLAVLLLLQSQDAADQDRALELVEESLALARDSGDTKLIPEALMLAGLGHQRAGGYERARALLDESVRSRRDAGSKHDLGPSLGALGYLALEQGDFETARACFDERAELWQNVGDAQSVALSIASLGELALAAGDRPGARARFQQALQVWLNPETLNAQSIVVRGSLTHILACFAWLATEEGQLSRAATLAAAATASRQTFGSQHLPSLRLRLDRLLTLVQQRIGAPAAAAVGVAARPLSLEEAIAYALGETRFAT